MKFTILSRTSLPAFAAGSLLLGVLIQPKAQAATTLFFEDFNDTTYAAPIVTNPSQASDGSGDYFGHIDGGSGRSSNASFTNTDGGYFGAQDTDGTPGADPVQLLFNDISIAGFTNLAFSGLFAEDDDGSNQDWDAGSRVSVFARFDDGTNSGTDPTSTQEIFRIEATGGTNTEPAIDTNFDGTGDGTAITDAFTNFTSSITGTGDFLDLIIEIEGLDAGDEDIAFDNITITGDPAGGTFWDATTGAGTGGSGTWNDTNTNWNQNATGEDATTNTFADGSELQFEGTAGIVDADNVTTSSDLTFNVDGYEITNNLTLEDTDPTITVTNEADTAEISATLSSANPITKEGEGELLLSGDNSTLNADLQLNAGELKLDGDNASGTGDMTANAGSIFATDGTCVDNAITVNGGVSGETQLYLEDFEGQNGQGAIGNGDVNNPTVDTSGVDWTVQVDNATLYDANDSFRVENGVMTANDTNAQQEGDPNSPSNLGTPLTTPDDLPAWVSPAIDISSFDDFRLDLDTIFSNTDYEVGGGVHSQDDFIVQLVIDGTTTIDLVDALPGDTLASIAGTTLNANFGDIEELFSTSGSSAQFFIYANNYAGAETIGFDNVSLTGISLDTATVTIGEEDGGSVCYTGDVTLNASVNLTAASGGTSTFDGIIADGTGSNNVFKQGEGSVVLNADNTYSGQTLVEAGILEVNGSIDSVTTVASGATLAGNSTVGFGQNVTLESGSTLSVGSNGGTDIGELGFLGDVDSAGATWLIDIAETDNRDFVSIAGALDISGASLNVDFTDLTEDDVYEFATYDTLTGTFASTSIPTGYEVDYNYNGTNTIALVRLQVIPEPATVGVLGALLLPYLARRQRKK